MSGLPEVSVQTAEQLLGGGGLVGLLSWLAARRKSKVEERAAKQTADQALIKLAQDAAAEIVTALRAEIKELRDDATEDRQRIAELEKELAEEKRARKAEREERHRLANQVMAAEKRASEAERARNEAVGALRQAQQLADSLARILRERGIPLPAPPDRSTEPVILGEPVA